MEKKIRSQDEKWAIILKELFKSYKLFVYKNQMGHLDKLRL